MAVFEYQAVAKNGRSVKGVLDADTPVAARRKLRDQDLYPTKVSESFGKTADAPLAGGTGRGGLRGISQRDISLATRQLAVLLQAGMPLVEALTALIEQTSNARLKKTIFDVRDRVNEGGSLADALGGHTAVFGDLYRNMVRAGESSGALEGVLFRLAEVLENETRLRNRIVSLMVYPIIMALFGAGIITFLMTAIVPKITDVFTKQQRELPAMTNALIAVSDFIQGYWPLIIGFVVVCFLGWRVWIAQPTGRRQWDRIKLKLPLFGPLYVKMICARIAQTLGTMLESGLIMMTALDVVKTVVQNRVVEEAMDDVKSGVRRGRDLAVPMRETGLFPPMMLHMIELGERSGEMESMLKKVAETYEEDVELTVNALVSLLEPMIMMIMGIFVGFLVMAILLPIFDMSTAF